MRKRNLLLVVVSLLAMLGSAFADRRPRQIPPPDVHVVEPPSVGVRHDLPFKQAPGSKLLIRAVEYNGSTNGTLKVQVKNPTQGKLTFAATGIYFVPDGNPETAPQRLGAVGPMQLASDAKEISQLEINAGATVEVSLEVFCIDSHRPSPSPQNKFTVGTNKLPKDMTATIERKATEAVESSKRAGNGAPRPAAKSRIQSDVWETRDKKWVPLDGEGSQEANKKR
jgi:hypothetical protein